MERIFLFWAWGCGVLIFDGLWVVYGGSDLVQWTLREKGAIPQDLAERVEIYTPAPPQSAGAIQKDIIVTNLCTYMDGSYIYALQKSELSDRVLMIISFET